ncbi:MAG TPA: 2-hydroxychromene-2-carboxylate isomerase [Xanthobacteraceae bacterium]|nr:2-hydroxychromene-2-carboxylate isomerase [Xanthobacteraceae bacterium]
MKPVKVQFLFDFGSLNAYFAHRVIPAIEQRTGATFEYVPILLGGVFKLTNNRSPLEAFGHVENKWRFMQLEIERFIKRHDIKGYHFNPNFPVNTLQLMRAAIAARSENMLAPYVEAAFHFMWEDPKKMDDIEVARAAIASAGIDADRLFARAQDADIKAELMRETQAAVDRGTFGSPTFFVGDEMFFGKDQLRDVEEAIVAAQKA